MPEVKTAQDVIRALRSRHPDLYGEWITYTEFERIDFFAMAAWPSKKHVRVGYEIKVSRGDFLNELRRPYKRMNAVGLCHEFYFATPVGLVREEEIPADCGLVEVHDTGTRVVRKAPRGEARPFSDRE